jgi:threonine dehydrogenase-like Zn-dependent dehydrogenase
MARRRRHPLDDVPEPKIQAPADAIVKTATSADGVDPVLLLTEQEPMTDVMAACRAFGQRQPGWRKVTVKPAA